MEKILILVSAVFLLGGAGMSFVKRSNFMNTRTEKDGLNAQIAEILDEYKDATKPQLVSAQSKLKETKSKKYDAEATLDLKRGDLTKRNKEIENVKAEQALYTEKLADANKLMAELQKTLAKLPGGADQKDIPKIIDGLKEEKRNLEEEVQTLTAELGVLRDDLEKSESWLGGYDDRQQKRAVRVSRNSLEAVITAVNNDYGVVVLKAGKENGVDNDSRLLVKRGPNIVGRLNIVSVEPYLTVASIAQESLAKGAAVIPGDRVIFQDLQK